MGIARRMSLALGGVALATIGRDRFLMEMQGVGIRASMLRNFIRAPELAKLFALDAGIQRAMKSDGRSDYSQAVYGTSELGGYGVNRNAHVADAMAMETKPRGAGPLEVEKLLRPGDRVVEVGCSDGEAIDYLASRNPDNTFVGLDFFTDAAAHMARANLQFAAGYPLETLDAVDGSIIFAHTTFVLVGPNEMRRYAEKMRSFRALVFTDPVRAGYTPDRYPGSSRLMVKELWGHDYRTYFSQYGFERVEHSIFPFANEQGKVRLFQKTVLVRQSSSVT